MRATRISTAGRAGSSFSRKGSTWSVTMGCNSRGGPGSRREVRCGGGAVRAGRQIQPGRGAIGIGQDDGFRGALGLPPIARAHGHVTPGEALFDGGHHRFIVDQCEAQQFGDRFAGEVIGGRAQSAGDQHHIGPAKGLGHRLANGIAIRHGDLALDPQAERKKRLADKLEMGVEDAAEEEFRAGIEDFDAHGLGRDDEEISS